MLWLFFLLSNPVLSCRSVNDRDRILYINSYHEGYPSSDDIRIGIMETLSGSNVALEIFYMDTKRYHLGKNVTGMLEVSPLRECIQVLKRQNPDICHLAVLSENTNSERSNTELLDTLYRNLGFEVEYRAVDDFDQWKTAFKEISASADIIYLPTNGAIRNWDRKDAISFVMKHTRVPTITTDDFMMDYAVFGMTKVASQQGEWAAATTLDILGGAQPSSIPYTRNSRFRTFLNRKLAGRIGFDLYESPPGGITEIQ